MAEMTLVKMANGAIRGRTQADDEAYKRHKGWLKSLGAGEYYTVSIKRQRNLKLHRKFFAMLNHAFEHWEPEQGRTRTTYKGVAIEKNFDAFREDILILSGYGEPRYDLKGRVHWKAKSIAFDKMDDEQFGEVYEAVLKVLLKHVLTNYKREDVDRVVAELEAFGS